MEAFIAKCIPLLNNYSDEFNEICKCICERQDEIFVVLENYLRQDKEERDVVEEKNGNIDEANGEQKISASEKQTSVYDGDFFPIQWPAVRNESRHQSLLVIYKENQDVLNQAYANIVSLMDHSTKKFLSKLTKYQKPIECYADRYSPKVLKTSTIEDVLMTIANAFGQLYYIEFITETNYPQLVLNERNYEVEDEVFREAFGNQLYDLHSYMQYVELSVDEFLKDDHEFLDQAFKLHLNICKNGTESYPEELMAMFRSLKIDQEALYMRMTNEYPIRTDLGAGDQLDEGLERDGMEELNLNLSNLPIKET